MEWLMNIYLGCFVFGLIFTVASFLLGGLDHFAGGHGLSGHDLGGHDIGSHDIHLASHGTGSHGHAHGHTGHSHGHDQSGHARKETLGWFNFNALVVFLTWFGGAGFILKSIRADNWTSVALAIASGVIGYMAVLLFMSKVLVSSQTPVMRAADYDLTGTVARVSGTIFENGTGEVIFSKHGTRRAVPARSVNGEVFQPDRQVVILRFEHGVALVDDLDRLLTEAGAEKWASSDFEASLQQERPLHKTES